MARDDPADELLEEIMEQRRQRLESVKENILIAWRRQKQQYDRKHSNPEVFAVGALISDEGGFHSQETCWWKVGQQVEWSVQGCSFTWEGPLQT